VLGREVELARVRALLAAARDGAGGVLVLEGEPGIGKTTVLGAAERSAPGFRCLSTRGVESEAALGHAALLELLGPLRDLLPEVPSTQAAALASALGWGPAEVPADRFLVGAGTLSLLAAAAETGPVLVLVDDVQWVDRESADALLFAIRRLGRDRVAFVLSRRRETTSPRWVDDLPVLELVGLQAADATALVPGLGADVAARLVDGTGGNPLAMLELGPRLTRAQRVGAAPLPEPLPVGDRLAGVHRDVLVRLSEPARRAVLLCAVAAQESAATVVAALDREGIDAVDAIDEAERSGVLVSDAAGVHLRHPLLRSAALQLADPAERRSAHRTLADVLPGPAAWTARTWHLAQASPGPDDALADELVAVADESRTRHGLAAASAALERAALLTGDPGRAAECLADACADAFVAGDVDRTRTLGRRVLDGPSGPAARARALLTLGTLEEYAGSVPRAARLLSRAADEADGGDGGDAALLVHVLTELALTLFRLNDMPGVVGCADRIAAVADSTDPTQRLLAAFTRGAALAVSGDLAGARDPLLEVIVLVSSPPFRDDPMYLLHFAMAAGFVGEMTPGSLVDGVTRLAEVRRRGAVGILVPGLAMSAAARAWLGDHDGAFADAGEAAELGEQLGYVADTAVAVEMLAWQCAARGRHEEAKDALRRARVLTDRAGTTSHASRQAITAAFCALSRGDPAEAASLLEARLPVDGGVGAMGEPLGVAPTLIEAYVALGRLREAADLAVRYAATTHRPTPPETAALVARCHAMTRTDDDRAVAAFEEALAHHPEDTDPFERARTRLLYGARLRRGGRRVDARVQLRAALDTFAAIGLSAWADRAAAELAATGARARPRGGPTAEPLTSQEMRVALLVAQGLSNRDVAAALFLSPKTVEHHLGRVFRKRGFRSRAELAGSFAARARRRESHADGDGVE
jgi:DNA-binding CsgD family transcriptional regulator